MCISYNYNYDNELNNLTINNLNDSIVSLKQKVEDKDILINTYREDLYNVLYDPKTYGALEELDTAYINYEAFDKLKLVKSYKENSDTEEPFLGSIILYENNFCDVYEGYGSSNYGTYSMVDNKLICTTIVSFGREGGPAVSFHNMIYEFDIIDDSTLKLVSTKNCLIEKNNNYEPNWKNGTMFKSK